MLVNGKICLVSNEYQNLCGQDQQLSNYYWRAEHLEAVLELDQPEDPSAAGLAGDLGGYSMVS